MNDLIKNREYTKLFFGTNQESGYDKPFLGFNSDIFLEVFKTDHVTYFHYPVISPIISLSASGLIESGAVAGPIPHYSDKIWKKQANYKKYIHWGDAQKQVGFWLCSWLSGNPLNPEIKPIWKDRWYNPGYLDSTSAAFVFESNYIIDIDSEMTLDPGVWYKYYHFGNNANYDIINSLSGIDGKLNVYLENWNEDNILTENVNKVPFNSNRLNDYVLELNYDNKNAYTQVLYNSSNELKTDFTASFWINVNDWQNPTCNTILGKELRGGWSFNFDNGFESFIFSIVSDNGNIGYGNLNNKIYFSKS